MDWLTVSVSLNLLLTLAVIVLVWKLRTHPQHEDERDAELAAELEGPADQNGKRQRLVIALEILNPLELVAERSWIGGKFSNLSPGLMHRIVVNQTRDQLTTGMKENGVEVDVRVIRLNP
ncbi:hypothetical protein FHR99_000991 [Litorivivens lipolytica]|uniref:Uncharacterized protein n=1 Tax=Litorivivens lipolytica TaxID=1524264 RepID=A0A7W4W3P7_9GAMM|nr:hypothetical protein [Litorivivens lipolytica]MBB3046755.1 hypothetical protein [Litorivivens lipolytica]